MPATLDGPATGGRLSQITRWIMNSTTPVLTAESVKVRKPLLSEDPLLETPSLKIS
jgi:hypothetical protein